MEKLIKELERLRESGGETLEELERLEDEIMSLQMNILVGELLDDE